MANVKKLSAESPESVLDIFEAIKRALMRKGVFREKKHLPKPSDDEKDPSKLVQAAKDSQDILFKATTVFPFTLFPDTVTLDREKMSFSSRYFFRVAKITSVPIRDILSVEAEVGPFFGSVQTASRFFIQNPKNIRWLWRDDATTLRRLLQGYIIAHEQKIDCSQIPMKKLLRLLEELGQGRTG